MKRMMHRFHVAPKFAVGAIGGGDTTTVDILPSSLPCVLRCFFGSQDDVPLAWSEFYPILICIHLASFLLKVLPNGVGSNMRIIGIVMPLTQTPTPKL